MALDANFFDSINIELLKRRFYDANKVNSLLNDIRGQAQALISENGQIKAELDSLNAQKSEIAEAMLSTRALCRDMVDKARQEAEALANAARAEAEELLNAARAEAEALNAAAKAEAEAMVTEARQERDAILSENLRQHELAVDKVESCFAEQRQRHLDAIEDINLRWQEFLCGLYNEDAAADDAPLPEDLPDRLDDIARQLEDISGMEDTEE